MKRVYIADDDPNITQLIKFSLASIQDVEFSYFDNGLDLYRKVIESPPDAVVTDIILPRLEGLAVTRLLKFDEGFRAIPVMVISSVIDPDIADQVKRVRADDFLRKPFRPADLRERVKALLEQRVPASPR